MLRDGVIPQLESIASAFLKAEWASFAARGRTYYHEMADAKVSKHAVPVNQADLDALIEMGFPRAVAQDALSQTHSLEEAVELVTGQREKLKAQNSKKAGGGGKSGVSILEEGVLKVEEKKNAFHVDKAGGLLIGLIEYLTYRMAFLNEVCPICDMGHMLGAPLLKPAVCRRELCVFAFSQLGLMKDCVDGVATNAEVVDLLLSMFKAAALSSRADAVVNPFPMVVDPDDAANIAVSDPAKHLGLVREICGSMQLGVLMESSGKASRGKEQHRLAMPLLQWVISSNRSHLVRLPEDKTFQTMGTKMRKCRE